MKSTVEWNIKWFECLKLEKIKQMKIKLLTN